MVAPRTGCIAALALAFVLACSGQAGATGRDWAAPQIRTVTQAGVLGRSVSTFAPESALTQAALVAALAATDAFRHPFSPTPLSPTVPLLQRSPAPAAPTAAALAQASSVSVEQLDAALVGSLGLDDAAGEIQTTLRLAGLRPRATAGSEAVARMLGLRLNHPAGQDDLELLPTQAATRAEAAWSFARVLQLADSKVEGVRRAADEFTLPAPTPWQRRILATAISYVGFPYVWGGTSATGEIRAGVSLPGGFDCSGFVWRVYKLTAYAGELTLAGALRGRTTYELSGEVPRRSRITAAQLAPGDVMFFGAHGPSSQPAEIDHAALYLGNGWLVQSSGAGVTLQPFDGWYLSRFAWGRRPLHEAGLE
jgi:cell wall-associated NlpC family hydrolase